MDITNRVTRPKRAVNNSEQTQNYIQHLNEQVEGNRKTHPSDQDDQEMNQDEQDEEREKKLVEMVKQNAEKKKQA